MRKQLLSGLMLLAFVTPAMVGCDRTVSEDKTVKTNPDTGKQTVDQTKTEKTADGGTKTTTEHKTSNPNP